MLQVFRLMNMPDRVIAFDELPEDLVRPFEKCRTDGFPRHWKEFLGKKKNVIKVQPERGIDGKWHEFPPIEETDCFFYLVDWTIGNDEEAWKTICSYVKANAPKDFRLLDNIEDMAVPLAPNKTDGVTLEPEEVPVIPLPKPEIATPTQNEPRDTYKFECADCPAEFDKKQALQMHRNKKHPKVAATA